MNKRKFSIILVVVMLLTWFAPTANAASLLRRGSRGNQVKALQNKLNELGYNCGKADGIFGANTEAAVKKFQKAKGLSADGIVGPKTVSALNNTQPSRGDTTPPKPSTPSQPSTGSNVAITSLLRRGSRGNQVKALQNRLNELGYNCGKADGIFGANTEAAVKKFQKAKGLSADGIVGKNTINKLYPQPKPQPKPEPKPQPKPEPKQLYRVRKSWEDAGSQIGAYEVLSNAKKQADENPGYKVFDSSGKVVYDPNIQKEPDPVPVEGTLILSKTKSNLSQMKAWAKQKGATDTFVELADIYWELAPIVGVNPEGAYCQAAHETGFGKFGGAVKEDFHNPCGLKTKDAVGDKPDDHQRFNTWEEGITAHIDHLALYAGAEGYPKEGTPDPRHSSTLKGRATTFKTLGGQGGWAPSIDYGNKIERYLIELYNTSYNENK